MKRALAIVSLLVAATIPLLADVSIIGTTTFSGGIDVVAGHIKGSGNAPTLTVCSGAGSSIVGSDTAGKVTAQAAAATTCTITFAAAFTTAPSCWAHSSAAEILSVVSTTTTLVFAGTAIEGDVISYGCIEGS